MKLRLALAFVLAVLASAALSDVAASRGFPHTKYLVEFVHDQSPRSAFVCTRRGSALGENFSSFDVERNVQTNCVLLLTGELRDDGSFDAYLGTTTWRGRWVNRASSVNIQPAQVRSVRRADFH